MDRRSALCCYLRNSKTAAQAPLHGDGNDALMLGFEETIA
jgi:hypothetical protein